MDYNGNNNKQQNFKQTNFIYFLIGFILPMFLIIYVSAEQPTIREIAEQAVDRTTTQGQSGQGTTVQLSNDVLQTSTSNKLTNTEDKQNNNQSTQGGDSRTVKDCEKIVMHNTHATEVAIFLCKLNPEKKMLAAFNQESGMNEWARGSAGEYGICQLMPNTTNNVWIKDSRRTDWKWQATKCVEKYLAVPKENRSSIWSSIGSNAYKKYLYLFNV